MKQTVILMLCLALAVTLQAQTATPAQTLAQANRAYTAGDYETAISLYQSLLEAGVGEGAVHFNLGSAYYESDQTGRALAHFLQAQRYLPRDADLNQFIARIQGERDAVQGDEQVPIDRLGGLTQSVMTRGELVAAAFVVWAVWFGLAAWMVWRPGMRGALRSVLVVLGIVLFGVLLLMGSRLYVEAARPQAVIIDGATPAYSGPAERYLQLYSVPEAAQLRVLERRDGWARFVLPDGRQGWLQADAMLVVG